MIYCACVRMDQKWAHKLLLWAIRNFTLRFQLLYYSFTSSAVIIHELSESITFLLAQLNLIVTLNRMGCDCETCPWRWAMHKWALPGWQEAISVIDISRVVIYSLFWDWCVSDFQLIRSSEKSHLSVLFCCGREQHLAGFNVLFDARRVSSECENVTKHAALIWQGQLWKWYDSVRYIRSGWLSHTKRSSCLRLLTHIPFIARGPKRPMHTFCHRCIIVAVERSMMDTLKYFWNSFTYSCSRGPSGSFWHSALYESSGRFSAHNKSAMNETGPHKQSEVINSESHVVFWITKNNGPIVE